MGADQEPCRRAPVKPKDGGWANSVPMAQGTGKTHPSMLTTDLSMRFDPIYGQITKRWLDHLKSSPTRMPRPGTS